MVSGKKVLEETEKLVEGLERLHLRLQSLKTEAPESYNILDKLRNFFRYRRYVKGLPVTISISWAVISVILSMSPLNWALLIKSQVSLLIGLIVAFLVTIFLLFDWIRRMPDVSGIKEDKELYNDIEELKNLYSDRYFDLLDSASTSLIINTLRTQEVYSRGDEEPDIALGVRDTVRKNIHHIRETKEALPIISFMSDKPPRKPPYEIMVTDTIQNIWCGVNKPPRVELAKELETWQESQPLFTCDDVHLRPPTDNVEIDFNKIFESTSKNLEGYKRNRVEIQSLKNIGLLLRTRISLDNDADERLKYVRICFWPKENLLLPHVQMFIEMQELFGIPTLWISRNGRTVKDFLEIWNSFYEGLKTENKDFLLKRGIKPFPGRSTSEWTRQFDFFVGPLGGYWGYGPNAPGITDGNLIEFCINLTKSLFNKFEKQIMWAKEIAWVEFVNHYDLLEHVQSMSTNKWTEYYNKIRKDSGFILRYPPDAR